VSIDLNGLKTVNDNEGHDAGDRLLIMAGEILKKVFYEDDLFRTGGDEFIVISESIDEKTFERKVKKLGAAAAKNDSVSFAVGTFWSDGSTDLTKALRIADERMYEAKKQYYEKNPQLRSR
jgi:diguanylate cyclase (GGDEF)-like protein